jgi:hypothetical protein
MFPRDMVCLRNISVDTLHKGDTNDDDDDDDDNNTSIFPLQYMTTLHRKPQSFTIFH